MTAKPQIALSFVSDIFFSIIGLCRSVFSIFDEKQRLKRIQVSCRQGMKNSILILLDFTRKLFKSRHMLWAMAMRDLRAKYIGSVFGFAWAVLNHLSQDNGYGAV